MQVIEATPHSAADREAVWRVVADARGWSRWGIGSRPSSRRATCWCGVDELRGLLHEQFDAVFDAGTVKRSSSFTRAPQGCLVGIRHSVQAQTSGMDLEWAAWFVMTVEAG